jgi:DNA-binding MarR family transcriptional regulator/GNAT superfamily N-acetyltransferase
MDQPAIEAVRRFGRFYTRHIGALAEGLLDSPHPLPEARVLFELGSAPAAAAVLATRLGMDAGQLSRLLGRLEGAGLLARAPDAADARRQVLRLTPAGQAAFAALDGATRSQVAGWLAPLGPPGAAALVDAMARIEALLDPAPPPPGLRPLRIGDIGWITAAHGRLYAAEFGWDWTFEAYVARACADFADRFDPARSAGWVLHVADAPIGSVLVQPGAKRKVAQLRMVLLEPAFRGRGLGRRLVETAEAFARTAGQARMELWTFDTLTAARALYAGMGYAIAQSLPATRFGLDMAEERWERAL